ncbi:MerR family transcriptional regulator [Photobacterium sanguinicancri]|uniref:MerR family transcriptional regulator n=1 Tax=Photobacterium sanguinicancri TaxID=875932 RepID=A0ABX4FWS5_9GAMM|nr:MerR family transcriptional regulator [Photobacterium sanguinicancri]OZS43266.1 MerR family transcriptional regulator [Photobacterium sanguinicancri]
MNISQFSALTGLSPHTLRYYEKIGLLASVSRNQSGHRNYSKRDQEWVAFITRLKETGMPLNQIMEYAKLREQGIETADQRKDLLEQHSDNLQKRIASELDHLEALKKKIDYYNQLI